MIAWVFIIVAIALIAYDPIAKAVAWYRKPSKRQQAIAEPNAPSRVEAFQAAEVLIAYYEANAHKPGADSAKKAAQWLFAEPE
jgi:aryl-alcohol dehydrogenase-like predicted oxidoreductase